MVRGSHFVLIALMIAILCAHVIGLQKIEAARSDSICRSSAIDRYAD